MSLRTTTCAGTLGLSLQASSSVLAERWLHRLLALVPVESRAVFPSDLLLDHIPSLIEEIGKYVGEPADEDIAARAIVIDKARELGQLRHQQQASLHQVLREYDLLGEILEEFVLSETGTLFPPPPLPECVDAWRRVGRAVRVLMQITAGTFIGEYIETVTAQGKRLDAFNRAIGHELRNVLGTLQFGAALLEGEATTDDARRRHLGATVRRSADRALKIIRSFERLPRSGVLADKPTEQTADIQELIHEVFRQLEEMASARGVELRMRAKPLMAHLDTGALELVLINLVANGIKYADRTKPDPFVAVDSEEGDNHYTFHVRDNGIGIPSDLVNTVFERFVRVHAHLDDQLGIEGTGLGLAIVEECVAALAGQVSVESQEHVGTTFSVRIPKILPVA